MTTYISLHFVKLFLYLFGVNRTERSFFFVAIMAVMLTPQLILLPCLRPI